MQLVMCVEKLFLLQVMFLLFLGNGDSVLYKTVQQFIVKSA